MTLRISPAGPGRESQPVAGQPVRPPRSLVLHADDLGFNPAVNRGIIDSFAQGLLTSTSVLANGPAVPHALALWNELELRRRHRLLPSDGYRRLLRDPWLPFDLGVHLNLTQGRPLTAGYPEELLDRQGRFPGVFPLFWRSLARPRRSIATAVEAELQAQVELLLDHGVALGHLNGHQYIECLPLVAEIVPRLANRYSLRNVRVAWEPGLTRQLLAEGRALGWGLAQVKRLFAFRWRLQASREGLLFPRCYFGTAHAGGITLPVVDRFLQSAAGDFVEIGLHPGVSAAPLRLHDPSDTGANPLSSAEEDGWSDPLDSQRPQERELLMGDRLPTLLQSRGWSLGRISQLALTSSARHRSAA